MKRFKYCTDEQMDRAVENYKHGGKSNLIYVRVFNTGQVETIEVFQNDIGIAVFDTEQEMYDYFSTSKPLVKDLVDGKQMELF